MTARSLRIALIACAVCAAGEPLGAQGTGNSLAAQIDSMVEAAMVASKIAGAGLTLVVDGQVVHQRGYGLANRETQRAVNPDSTLFGISSISKVFTTIAVLQQAERGQLTLARPINQYLPSFRIGDSILVKHLLTHTAGFDDLTIGISAREASGVVPLGEYLLHDLPPRVRPAGLTASYSNHGFALAGLLVEKLSGQPFAEYMTNAVLRPLGMRQSGFEQPLGTELEQARALPYRDDGSLVPRIFFNDAPASAMYATVGDMSRFIVAFVKGDSLEGVLHDLSQMRERQFSHHPALNGLTFGMRQRRDRVPAVEQGGDWDDYSSDLIIAPGTRSGLFIAMSGGGAARLADSLWKLVSGPALAISESAVSIPVTNVNGTYRLNRHSRNSITRTGVLFGAVRELRIDDGALLNRQLEAVDTNLYRMRGGQLVAIRRDADGRATHLFIDNSPYAAYERVKWWERRELHLAILLVSIVTIVAVLWRAAVSWPLATDGGAAQVWRRAASVTASAGAILLLGVIVTALSSDLNEFQYGLPAGFQVLLGIGTLTIPASMIALISSAFVPARRAQALGTSCVLVLFALFTIYWHLLPRF